MNTIDPNFAASLYARNTNIGAGVNDTSGDESGETGSAGGAGGGLKFSDFLKSQARDAVDTMRKSESMSAKAVTGEADLTDVVQAVTSAELTLQTVVAVRDRMITAYKDIMTMPI
ncbi:MAG: flagellar hook-basal body complex protein FliE [Bdellovibrionales bacterium]